MKILFLHGKEGHPNGTKARFIKEQGFEINAPSLPKDDWQASIETAQNTLENFCPNAIVGSSRGGAVACALKTKIPKILIAPAYKFFKFEKLELDQSTIILHSPKDPLIMFQDSEELKQKFGVKLISCGDGHRMSDPQALEELLKALKSLK